MHSTQKIGRFWENIPNCKERQCCKTCHETESMKHILTQCPELSVRIAWRLAKDTWPHTNIPWPDISIGLILGCGSITTPSPPDTGRIIGTPCGRRIRKSRAKPVVETR